MRETVKLKDYRTNTLSHVESHLIFNIPSWEGGSLVPGRDTNLYTCSSSSNSEGPGVNSTTLFRSGDMTIILSILSLVFQSSLPAEKYQNISLHSNS